MNINSTRSYNLSLPATERSAVTNKAALPVNTGVSDADTNRQTKPDTYTASDMPDFTRGPAEAQEASPVYTRALLYRNAQLQKPTASPEAAPASQQTPAPAPTATANALQATAAKVEENVAGSTTPVSNADTGSHGGANVDPNDIATPAAATKMIQDLKGIGGGTLRIQMTHDQLQDTQQMDKLTALINEGDKQGVHVQFTFRDNANGGGGSVLTGDKLKQASADISNVVKKFGSRPSSVLDTFNEGGTNASQGWADMESELIKAARSTGYTGSIVVEDSNWGGGLTAGPESGLVKYADQLKAANGKNNPGLIGSIHEYANDANASARLASEIKALQLAGYKPQIGEVGNANWLGGDKFEERDGATQAVRDNLTALKAAGADILPWKDQFQNGKLRHHVGFLKSDQY
ncbi:type III effector HopAH1 [Pseudomonas syringae pv. helianthi]|uniref:Type III effector HopAH1 n=1 Tax=Pseudomonas syringae pv. helianthi TaxID=251654 RepID=A0A0P9SU08_9PSED|nr:cellulase family glycosylhydrolase [Pseudomonas syringae group genomosp. 7]KPX46918.1 type III effector HopAH1 [Pseudomonas syringae pv. helianthi]UNB65262.1 glycoside hydrolase family 5 protein [Pseudomonas syringae pv. helianthi]